MPPLPGDEPDPARTGPASDETRVERSPGPETTPIPRTASSPDATGSVTPDASPSPLPGVTASGAAFTAGSILAGRYRVVRFIAEGAMGEVYEVEDETLRGRLALKTIQPQIAADARAIDRFKREIHLARKVTHPNVSRIYDLGVHTTGTGSDIVFLTMELLAGPTLHGRVREARMTTAMALPIVRQMAAGLDAAHAHGIIHRDFKSGNVLLVPHPRTGTRAVVTDFGLARPLAAESGLASISESGLIVGTPAYMAPEQVKGAELTTAADIYALGIVIYEMVTGVRPFDGGSAMTVAVRRLTDPPAPPRVHVPDLDPVWEAVILKCLAREPADRYQGALEVVEALGGGVPTTLPTRTGGPARRPGPWWPLSRRNQLAAALAIVLVSAALVPAVRNGISGALRPASQVEKPMAAAPAVAPRRTVAVLGLANASKRKDADWLGTAISEMLITDLAAGDEVRVLPGREMARIKRDLALGDDADTLSAADMARIRASVGADLLVVGYYTLVGDGEGRLLRIDLRLQEAADGKLITSAAATGTEAQLFDLVSRAGREIRQKLGLADISPAEAVAIEASLPGNAEAARLYAEGLSHLHRLDALGAKALLEKAVAADPKHPAPHAALGAAWAALGYDARALEQAKLAASSAGALPRDARLTIEARYHEALKDWDKAIEIYAAVLQARPDDVETGLLLVNAQISGGKIKEAMATLDSLRSTASRGATDPRLDLAQARAFERLGDFKKQQEFAAAAAEKGRAAGARLIVAQARLIEAMAWPQLGDAQKAARALEEARGLYEAAGDRPGLARSLEGMAAAVYDEGDLAGARRLYDRALAAYLETGDQRAVARVRRNFGTILLKQGKLAEAERMYEEALATFQQIGAKYEAAGTLLELGTKLHLAGDLAGAQKRYQSALTLFGEVGTKSGIALALTNLAELFFIRGDLDQARVTHEEALALDREIGAKSGTAYDLYRLGEVFFAKGDLVVASGRYQEALKIQDETGEKIAAAETRGALARLAVAQGRAAEGEQLARQSEEVLRTEGAVDRAALAQAILASALLPQGKLDQAREASESALKGSRLGEDRTLAFAAATVHGQVRAASGKPADVAAGSRELQETAAAAGRAGYVGAHLEARVALAEVATAAGLADAPAQVAAVTRDARAKGFEQIARRASAIKR
jgi:tetratricopeptide (TPR) repeat protein/tRNA A-37 threonylcarbamoyl transferase component Bud32